MFYFSRLLIILPVLLAIILLGVKLFKNKRVSHDLFVFLSTAFVVGVMVLTIFFPTENLFKDFESMESAVKYYKNSDLLDVVEGEESSMALYAFNDDGKIKSSFLIFPKAENGYDLPYYYGNKRLVWQSDERGTYSVYNLTGTSDYYVYVVIDTKDGLSTISDSNGNRSEFIIETLDGHYIFCFLIEEYTEDYCIDVGGQKIDLGSRLA